MEDTLPLIQYTIPPSIRVETDLADDVSNVKADYTQMQMVLSALIANASEAMEGPGCIRIFTRNEEIGEKAAKQHLDPKPGRYVYLTVEDDGRGMDEETRAKIFDPFFTTKFQGRGLGMAAVHGIVKNHDGWIFVHSESGRGSAVRIYLPASDVQVEEKKRYRPDWPTEEQRLSSMSADQASAELITKSGSRS